MRPIGSSASSRLHLKSAANAGTSHSAHRDSVQNEVAPAVAQVSRLLAASGRFLSVATGSYGNSEEARFLQDRKSVSRMVAVYSAAFIGNPDARYSWRWVAFSGLGNPNSASGAGK